MKRLYPLLGALSFLLVSVLAAKEVDSNHREADLDYEELLAKKLLQNYDKTIRPGVIKSGVKDQLKITAYFSIRRILASDDRLETISLLLHFRQNWLDQRLKWDPTEFGNITVISLEKDLVWTPQSLLPNLENLNADDTTASSRVFITMARDPTGVPSGNVTLVTYAIVQERCAFDMTYFPFDHQTCKMCAINQQYTSTVKVPALAYQTIIPTQFTFAEGGQWDLVDVRVEETPMIAQSMSIQACFSIVVQRRSLYYVINLFFPTVTICVLNTIGLFMAIDTESGELDFSSLGQTTLLSLGVLLLTVADQTPRGSGQISVLGRIKTSANFKLLFIEYDAFYGSKC